jgi:hypothetical protein
MVFMKLLEIILEVFGLGWLILIIMIGILGGKVLIQLKNPITKKLESITDITIEHNEKNPG